MAEYGHGVALIDDQGAVEELAADGADEAFSDGVGPRRPTGVLTIWIPLEVKTASKAAVN